MSATPKKTETAPSIFSRLRLSAWGVLLSAALFLAGAVFSFVAEKNTDKDGEKGAELEIVTVQDGRVLKKNEGKPVWVYGLLTTDATLKDSTFGLAIQAVKLRRKVEMFQWRQTKAADASVRYERVWWPTVLDSSRYAEAPTHRNPSGMDMKSAVFVASNVKLGQFTVSRPLVDQYDAFTSLSTDRAQRFPVRLGREYKPFRGGYFKGASPASPWVGDLRVRFEIAPEGEVSILARQVKGTLVPFENAAGGQTALLFPGKKNPGEVVKKTDLPKSYGVIVFRALGAAVFFLAGFLGFAAITTLGQRWPAAAAVTSRGSVWFSLFICAAGYSAAGFAARWTWVWMAVFCLVLLGAWFFFKTPDRADDKDEGEEKWEAGAVLTGRDWIQRGARFFAAGNLSSALDAFSTAVYLDDQLAPAYFNRSVVLRKMGRPKQALLDIKKAAELGHPKAIKLIEALKAKKRALRTKSGR